MPDLAEIRDAFDVLEDWEDRYRFIIDLGKALRGLDSHEYVDENRVHGCQSNVWIVAALDESSGTVSFQLDSDAFIVKGLIAVVLAAYDGKSPKEVVEYDIESLFAELDLMSHLSMTRGNGLRAMVQRLRHEASNYLS